MQQNLPKMLHKAEECEGIPVVLATRPLGQLASNRAGVKQNSSKTVARLPEYLEPDQIEALILQARRPSARLLLLAQWRGAGGRGPKLYRR